jgi:glycosyltransferase involved in cell wall biosynthesis
VEKGLAEALEVARVAKKRGLVTKILLAGPLNGVRERILVDEGSREGYVDYRGAVLGPTKDAFFREVDVFLFPSRYRNELSPLVVWESLLRGIPVIGYTAGCLTQSTAGSGSLVLDPRLPLLDAAIAQLEVWKQAPEVFAEARRNSRDYARERRNQAVAEALLTGERLRTRAFR